MLPVYVERHALCQRCFMKMWEGCNQSLSSVLSHDATMLQSICACQSYCTKYNEDVPQPETAHSLSDWMCHKISRFKHGQTINLEHSHRDKPDSSKTKLPLLPSEMHTQDIQLFHIQSLILIQTNIKVRQDKK